MVTGHLLKPCLPHSGAISDSGYGADWFEGSFCGAHRKAYCEHHGKTRADIKGKVVRHRCDNRACREPTHLELGSNADNSQDMVDRGRQGAQPCLSIEDAREIRLCYVPGTRWNPSPTGQRQLASKFGVTQSVIQQIVNNITYKE